jgi:hypothetical protein
MRSTEPHASVVYEGKADMWQGAAVSAATASRSIARPGGWHAGAVKTQLLEKKGGRPASPLCRPFHYGQIDGLVYTIRSPCSLHGRCAAHAAESAREVARIASFLSEDGSDNRLDKAYADGKVELQQSAPGRTRTGTSEHAEYFTSEEKIILRGGSPMLVDSVKGNTRGDELTYFSSDDRLLVNGVPDRPATSRLRRN